MGEWALPTWVLPVLGPIGAAIVAAWGTIIVTRIKMRSSKDYYDNAATRFLVDRLGAAGGFSFDDAKALGEKIGLEEMATKRLLFLAGFVPAQERLEWIKPKRW